MNQSCWWTIKQHFVKSKFYIFYIYSKFSSIVL